MGETEKHVPAATSDAEISSPLNFKIIYRQAETIGWGSHLPFVFHCAEAARYIRGFLFVFRFYCVLLKVGVHKLGGYINSMRTGGTLQRDVPRYTLSRASS